MGCRIFPRTSTPRSDSYTVNYGNIFLWCTRFELWPLGSKFTLHISLSNSGSGGFPPPAGVMWSSQYQRHNGVGRTCPAGFWFCSPHSQTIFKAISALHVWLDPGHVGSCSSRFGRTGGSLIPDPAVPTISSTQDLWLSWHLGCFQG